MWSNRDEGRGSGGHVRGPRPGSDPRRGAPGHVSARRSRVRCASCLRGTCPRRPGGGLTPATARRNLAVGRGSYDYLAARGVAAGVVVLGRDLVADLLQRAADQARHVHLRDPDLLGDLRLREAFEEAQVEDLPLPVVENAEAGREDGAVLGDLVGVLLRADRLERVEIPVVVLAAAGRE